MKKTYTIASLILGLLLAASGLSIIAAPQTGNDRLNEDQMYQQAFVADDGTIQVKVTGRAIPTPQTGNDRLSTVQMLQQAFVAADGTFQAVLDESSSGIPFVNYSGLADNDLLQYDTTDTAWENITQASLLHNNFGGLTTGDPHTQYQKETAFTAGSVLFRGASAITEDNSGLFYHEANKWMGLGTKTPDITSSGASRIFAINTDTGGGFTALILSSNTFTSGEIGRIVFTRNGGNEQGRISVTHDFGSASAGSMSFLTDNGASLSEKLRITSGGNVGINTTAPARRLESIDTTNPQERWTHTSGSVYGEVQATSAGYLELNATGNRILLGKDDSDKAYWGAGYDFSAYYDGTAAILKTDEVAASDLQLTTGAAKTLMLNTPVYDDLNFDPDRSGGPVATQPDSVTINNVFHREFTSANNQLCGAVQELPHGYKLSSTLYPHIHIFLKASETVGTTGATFTLYWELRQSTGTTSGSVPLAATSAQLGTTAGGNSLTLYDATGFAGSAELGGQLALTIARTAGDAGDVVVTTYGVHYAVDTIGSRLLDTK
jgi:hypothetical protein